MIVKLLEKQPFMHQTDFLWYDEGSLFEVIDVKTIKGIGKCYKLKDFKRNIVLDGWNVMKSFEEFKGV